jgi:hypothetical protein
MGYLGIGEQAETSRLTKEKVVFSGDRRDPRIFYDFEEG